MESVYLLMECTTYCCIDVPDEHRVVSAHENKPEIPPKRTAKDGTSSSYFYVDRLEIQP